MARYAELGSKISENTKENIENTLKGEISANKEKREAAVKAKEVGVDETSRDEGRHAESLESLF